MRFYTRSLFVLFSLFFWGVSCDNRPLESDEPDAPTTIVLDDSSQNPDPEPDPNPDPNPDQPIVSLYSYLGVFKMRCIETYNRTNEQWDVNISTTSARRNNDCTWVVISGLYYGYDFMNAYGYYDPINKCIRIPANIPDNENTFYFINEGSEIYYYAKFTPCRLADNWSSFYYTHDKTDEMWLRVESNGQLRLGAADGTSPEEGAYYDSYTFYYYYASTGTEPKDNYFYVLTDAVFTRISSSAPARQPRRLKQQNHNTLLRGMNKNTYIVSHK